MYTHLFDTIKNLPTAYESTGIAFWDDGHISKSMLQNHLAPERNGASRKHDFIQKSVGWIASLSAPGNRLLDLGCGPGVYAEFLHNKGYQVTGIDFSRRSIEYAQKAADSAKKSIDYIHQDYLTIDYHEEFDLAIMIYCDFGVLAPKNRKTLLDKVYAALRPGGLFIVDVFTLVQYENFADNIMITFEDAGFWRPTPHLCIQRNQQYDNRVFLKQYTILTESDLQTYNLWNHAFMQSELAHDLHGAEFAEVRFYGDVAGSPTIKNSPTICAVSKKP